MEKLSILINKTYLSRSKLERDEEERRAVVRDETNNLSDKHKCEEARVEGYAEKQAICASVRRRLYRYKAGSCRKV